MSRYQTPYLQYFDAAGKPLAGGKLFFYDAGTNDLKTVFTDIDQTIPSENPVTLNANGSVSNIFYSGLARVVLQNATGTQIFDIDDVGPEDLAGLPPLYVSDATYSLNDVVKTADGLYYRSIQNGNAGNTPSPSSEYWEKIDFIYTYNANNSYQIDDVVKLGGQLYISTITANQGNSPATSNNWRKLTTLAEFEYLSGGLSLNKVNYAVGTKAHVKSFSAATGGKYSYWVKQATTGPASKLPSERLDLQCTDALGAVWSLQHSGTVYISSIGGDEGADNGLVFRAYDTKANYLDLEGKTWPCTSLSTDNGAGREILQSKVFNGKLVVTNGLNGETNVQTFAPFLESEVQLSETKSPIVDWTGLNVLWLGTSIPHQAVGVDGYPERLAEKLNFTVQNWAWSGSHAFYDIDGDAFDSGTVRALSMTEADRLAGLATYGSSSAYDDSFDIVTKASQQTTEYRIKRQFESGAIDCVVLDHNHNDRKNIAGYTANDKTINAVVKGTSTTFTLDDVGGLFEGDGCYVRVEGIDELDYAAGRITGISGSQVTVAIDSSGMAGTFTSGEFKFVDRNTVDGAFDFLIAYTKNMFIRYGNAEGKIILCGAPSYFTNDVDRDHAIWSVNRSIKAIADKWELSFFDVANALRLTYHDHVTYLPDDVHPSTPETRKVFANIWAEWMNGGAGNFYNPEEVLQRNKLIDNENNQPALYSKYDQSFATRDVIYTEDDPLINEDFSGGLGAWTQLGTGTPTVVSAPWGSGDAAQFDVLSDNTAPYIRQNAVVGATPVLEFDFYMPSVDVATGTTQQVTIASINAAGGAGYSVGIIQTVGGATQLRATYNKGGFGLAPVVPLPGATLTITDATKYRVKIDVVDGYIFFSVDGNKLYAGALDNSLLGAASSVLVGPTFTNMGSAFSVFIGNVVAGAKSEQHVMTTEELQKTVQSYTLDELTSMSPTLTGRRVICSDLADAPFELAPIGYVAQSGDRVADNGRVWALVIDEWLNVEHLGVKLDGTGDNAALINGGYARTKYIFSKGGEIRLESQLQIPAGGAFVTPNGMSGKYIDNTNTESYAGGLVFNVEFGENSANYYSDAAIQLGDNARLSGVSAWYPNQPLNVTTPTYTYPPFIAVEQGVRGAVISDINLGNAYIGIDARRDQSAIQIDNVKGYPLAFGIRIGSNTDPSQITRINLSPVQQFIGVPWVSPNITPWVARNGVMIEVGRMTWASFEKVWGIAYGIGVDLINQVADAPLGINTGGSAQNCNITNCGFDKVEVAIRGRGFQGRLKINGFDATPRNFNDNPLNDTYAIDLANESGSIKSVKISNVDVWSVAQNAIRLRRQHGSNLSNVKIHSLGEDLQGTGILLDNSFRVKLNGVEIDGDNTTNSSVGIDAINTCDYLKISDCQIDNVDSFPIRIDATDYAQIKGVNGSNNGEKLVTDISATKKYNNVIKDVRDSDPSYTNTDVSASVLNIAPGRDDISYSGTTAFSGITHGYRGETKTIRFSAACTVTDEDAGVNQENRLYMNGNFTTSFGDTLTLKSYGNLGWYEISRSSN